MNPPIGFRIILLATAFVASVSYGANVQIAVAANFRSAMKEIVTLFEEETDHDITLIVGSTGRLYAQILNAAPFEIFFAADDRRPIALQEKELIVPGTRITYATGSLVLWSPDSELVDSAGAVLEKGDSWNRFSIANPNTAPYGEAAREVLSSRGLWEPLRDRIVTANTIAQTFQQVSSGSADLGFVAVSQIAAINGKGSSWSPPENSYKPLVQQAVLLLPGAKNRGAREFMDFARSNQAIEIIRRYGYKVTDSVDSTTVGE